MEELLDSIIKKEMLLIDSENAHEASKIIRKNLMLEMKSQLIDWNLEFQNKMIDEQDEEIDVNELEVVRKVFSFIHSKL